MLSQEAHGTAQYRIMGAGEKACPGEIYTNDLGEAQAAAVKASKRLRSGVWVEVLMQPMREYALYELYRNGALSVSYPELVSFYRQQPVVGLKEAAEILGWDPRRVTTYRKRGSFPEPIQTLAATSVWFKSQIEDWKASRATT